MKDIFLKTAIIRSKIRKWFESNQFIEVRTSSLSFSSGFDIYIKPFKISLDEKEKRELFLITSPEFEMKGLLAEGLSKIWQITRVFRKEEIDSTHRPDFDMLEWYKKGCDYKEIMQDTEDLIRTAVLSVAPSGKVYRNKNKYDFSKPFEKISLPDIFFDRTGLDLAKLQDKETFFEAASSSGFSHITENYSWDDIFFTIFLTKVEPEILRIEHPVLLYDFPYQIISLAKRCKERPQFVERFECYGAGLELCNGYTELADWNEHLKRFEELKKIKKIKNFEEPPFPSDLEKFIKKGIGLCSGVAIGMERLFMAALSCNDIKQVIFNDLFIRGE